MFTKILNEDETKKFVELTSLKASKVFISKNKKYYYAIIFNHNIKIRISRELASKFI
mgnify:FL=1